MEISGKMEDQAGRLQRENAGNKQEVGRSEGKTFTPSGTESADWPSAPLLLCFFAFEMSN